MESHAAGFSFVCLGTLPACHGVLVRGGDGAGPGVLQCSASARVHCVYLISMNRVVCAAARDLLWCVNTGGLGHLELSLWLGAECSRSLGESPLNRTYEVVHQPVGRVPCGNPEALGSVPARGARCLPPDPQGKLCLPASRSLRSRARPVKETFLETSISFVIS